MRQEHAFEEKCSYSCHCSEAHSVHRLLRRGGCAPRAPSLQRCDEACTLRRPGHRWEAQAGYQETPFPVTPEQVAHTRCQSLPWELSRAAGPSPEQPGLSPELPCLERGLGPMAAGPPSTLPVPQSWPWDFLYRLHSSHGTCVRMDCRPLKTETVQSGSGASVSRIQAYLLA